MDRGTIWTAALLAAALAGTLTTGYAVRAADRRALDDLRLCVEGLSQDAHAAEAPAAAQPAPDAELARTLAELAARVEELESRSERVSAVALPPAPIAAAEPARGDPPAAGAATDAERRELDDLLGRLIRADWDFSELGADFQRFLELARSSGALDQRIAELERGLEANPGDLAARMLLADHYVGKLMTVSGPEQGMWGSRAETQWKRVVELDDANWPAHAKLGVNYSYYPEVMGKRGVAIHHLERALEIQRNGPPEPGHVGTYVYLARLHAQAGDSARARVLLTEGLARHPGQAELERALAELGG